MPTSAGGLSWINPWYVITGQQRHQIATMLPFALAHAFQNDPDDKFTEMHRAIVNLATALMMLSSRLRRSYYTEGHLQFRKDTEVRVHELLLEELTLEEMCHRVVSEFHETMCMLGDPTDAMIKPHE